MAFLIGNVRVMVIALVFIVTAIPELASSELTITVEHKKGRKNDESIAELSKTEQPKSPEGPTTLESKNGEPTTPESTEGAAETTAEGTQETTTQGTEAITSEGPATTQDPVKLTTICLKCAFKEFGRKATTTTSVPEIPTQEAVTELQPTTTPVPEIPTQEAVTEPPTITPVPEIPTQEAVTELPPTITPIPEIPTQEAVTEVTKPSIPTTEKRTPRPPPPMTPLPPPKAYEKPDVGLTVPPVVSPKGYSGGEITPPTTHCPPNEVYKECDFLCQPSCKRLVRPKKCPYICIPRCLCKKPLVRRESDGKCVHRSMCPKCKKPKKRFPKCPKCKKPDEYPYDRNIFKPPTDNRRPPTDQRPPIYPPIDQEPPTDQRPPIYPPIDQGPPDDQFELSTDYEDGFYPKRPPTHQGWKKCPPQEVFSMCAGACQATCRRPRPKCARGCICRKPFVRREADGKCVPRSKCHCKKRKC